MKAVDHYVYNDEGQRWIDDQFAAHPRKWVLTRSVDIGDNRDVRLQEGLRKLLVEKLGA